MTGITHIDHIAIAVARIADVKDFYEKALGLKISEIEEMPERGIRTAFIKIGQSMIELIEPMRDDSEISNFLIKKGPGIHHIAFATPDIIAGENSLRENGCTVLYEKARPGAHHTQVNFVHPKSAGGVLIELVEHAS